MSLRLRAITPRNKPIATNVDDLARRVLGQTGFAGDMIREMSDYPQQQPTTYVRTGNLGRNWRLRGPSRIGRSIAVEVFNVTPYALHVEGPRPGRRGRRQTDEMRRRGWPNISSVAQRLAKKHNVELKSIYGQRSPRLRRERL